MRNATVIGRKCRARVRVALSGSVIGAVLASAFPARAALITWSSPITFKDDTVLISPTAGYAVSFGPGGSGGVTTGSAAGASSSVTFGEVSASTATISGTSGASNIYLNASDTPNTTGDIGFDNVITTAASNGTSAAVGNITLHNLTATTKYQLQLFFADARVGSATGRTFVVSDGTTGGLNTTAFQFAYGAAGNTIAGATITGTFTADSTVQNFTTTIALNGAKQGTQINALVLAVAPEPASAGLLALGLAGLALRRARRDSA